jgi:hypothetical protein
MASVSRREVLILATNFGRQPFNAFESWQFAPRIFPQLPCNDVVQDDFKEWSDSFELILAVEHSIKECLAQKDVERLAGRSPASSLLCEQFGLPVQLNPKTTLVACLGESLDFYLRKKLAGPFNDPLRALISQGAWCYGSVSDTPLEVFASQGHFGSLLLPRASGIAADVRMRNTITKVEVASPTNLFEFVLCDPKVSLMRSFWSCGCIAACSSQAGISG